MDHTGMQHMGDTPRKLCITVQTAEGVAKLSTSSSQLRKVADVKDIEKLPDAVAKGPYIEDQEDK